VSPQPTPGTAGFRETAKRLLRRWGFLLATAAVYLLVAVRSPEKAGAAVVASWGVLLRMAPPLAAAFVFSCLLNLFVKPARVANLMGREAGTKGVLLSTVAGVVSMGPVYAWYPLLRSLRQKGASSFHLANFLSSRAVKPYLLPVMVSYFGWRFVLTISVFCLLGALLTASAVSWVACDETGGRSG